MAATGCVLLVLSLFDAMSHVRSADMRDEIAAVPGPRAAASGSRSPEVVDLLRGLVLFSGALAAAGAVLAVFALQRHRGARIGLTVVAALMLFSATFVSGILPVLVAVAASMLWGREARDWFAGRAPRSVADRNPNGPPAPDRAAVWPSTPPALRRPSPRPPVPWPVRPSSDRVRRDSRSVSPRPRRCRRSPSPAPTRRSVARPPGPRRSPWRPG